MIDIIIPCYNAHKTIDRCIGSILIQTAIKLCKVTLVNDGGNSYNEIIERYKPILDIQEIGYADNRGPGGCRNFGIENTSNKYLTFIDSDDVFASPFSIASLYQTLDSDSTVQIVIANFLEELPNKTVNTHEKDYTFMHGKMYRRSYLDKYNIRFGGNLRCNEDMGFNMLCLLLLNNTEERAVFSNFMAYYWMCNQNSIARKDRIPYNYRDTYKGMVDAFIYLFTSLENLNRHNTYNILREKVASMLRCIQMYADNTAIAPQFESDNFKQMVYYYNEIYKKIKDKVTPELLSEMYDTIAFKGNKERLLPKVVKLLEKLDMQ